LRQPKGFLFTLSPILVLTTNHFMKNLACILLFLGVFSALRAQNSATEKRPGEIIVQLEPGITLPSILTILNRSYPNTFAWKQDLAVDWNMYLLETTGNQDNAQDLLRAVQRLSNVRSAQWNHKVQERSLEPNDADWFRQDDMTLINAPEVWSATIGGLTPQGDTIVVAVMEKGGLYTHPDLAANRFWNWLEIPDNGVDDDNNGYIDDFGGWNPQTQADDMGGKGFHGTAVAGIIGAKGNNEIGVTGVNWDVKLMNIAGMDYESEIIQGYQYVGRMRKVYNQTNGAKGAFIVATNASFGFDFARAEDHPVWCAVYDSLGKVGVLSVGATINSNVNVDLQGDMPTSCPSEYLIAVTNINKSGNRVFNSGYGEKHIDLGAPGQDTYTTYNSGTFLNDLPSYGMIGGCSAAAPHVAGGIALLYSLDCEIFTSDAISDPISCVRRVRDAILENVEPNTSLKGLTVTAGHLDLGRSLEAIREWCKGAKVGPLEIPEVRIMNGGNMVRIYYQTPNFQPYSFRLFNMLGQQLYETKIAPQQFSENYVDFDVSNLPKAVYVISIGRGDVIKSVKFPKN